MDATTMGIDSGEEKYLKETSDTYYYQFTVVMNKNIQFHIVIQSDGSEWLVSDEFDKAILLLPLPDICM